MFSCKPIAFFLIGVPGCGKTTWSKPLLDSGQFDLISTDFFIDQYAKTVGKTYTDVFKDYIKTAEKITNEYVNEVVEGRRNLIWDQTNTSAKARKSKLDKLDGYIKIAVVFNISEKTQADRLQKRDDEIGKFIPANILKNMREHFEYPSTEEGFIQIIDVNYE
jgi:adenylate kinase family enzyme